MSNRQLEQLRTDMLAQFTAVRDELRAMLPREIYNVEKKQTTDDIAELQARIAKLETATIDLNTQLLRLKQQTPAQIAGATGQVRYEALNRAFDLATKILFAIGGAILTYIAYHH